MQALRLYIWPSMLAAIVLSMPFAACVFFVSWFSVSPPRTLDGWLVVLGYAVLADLIVAVLPFAFFVVARVSWREKEKVVRQHLFGWPVALGIVCFVFAMLATAVVDDLTAFWTLVYFFASAAVSASGVIAARIWLRLSYP